MRLEMKKNYQKLLKLTDSVFAYPLAEHVPDLTSKNDIVQVKEYLEKHYKDIIK